MKAKEKAKNLIDIFYPKATSYSFDRKNQYENAKQCALITVDEIIKSNPCFEDSDRGGNFMWNNNTSYWEEVKKEIENI